MGLSQTHSRARLDARRSLTRRAAGESTAIRRVGIAALVVLAYVALAVSRRPESFTSPQFYAEDGQWWYAGAHNASPLHLLFTPLGGYLIVFQGLVAALCAPLGLTHAALAYAVVATILQVAPALMFASYS